MTQLGQQQDDMISRINLLWKVVFEKLDDAPIQQNRNPLSPKRVHIVNSIVILNKEDEAKKEGNVKTSTTEYKDHEMTVEREDEYEEETEDEIEKEKEDSPKHFDTFPTTKELRVKGLKVFVGNFTYECDFMLLEDTTSVIDHDLGSIIFGKPFVEATGLVYDKEEGTNTFEKDEEKIMFRMPHKMEMLYLMRRSLEVLRKFHWMILGGQFNQFLALGWLLEEIHVTWAHLEKKRARLRTYTKSLKDLCIQWLETASQA
ncbi:hypothetical protein Tco_0564406 [Tanacetum coccineum]